MRETLKEYCVRFGREELLEQWHPEKNIPLTPDIVSYGSQKKIWWSCEQGHEWTASVYARSGKHTGCPYCTGKRVAPELTLSALYPEIAQQWHPTKNAQHKPEDYLPGSHTAAWWLCDKGHEWKAMIKSRVEGSGCPVCANKAVIPGENDLASCAPLVAAQWHPTKNGNLTPWDVPCGTIRRVWWRCERGHEWQAGIDSRVSGKGCPYCGGLLVIPGETDLKTVAPEIAEQWCYEKNGKLRPGEVSAYSNKKVWWRCDKGHEWQVRIASRTSGGSGCPVCSGRQVLAGFNDLQTKEPRIAAEWHPTKNGTLEPTMVTVGSTKKVWWKCPLGHEWKAIVYSRATGRKCGCPECAGKPPRTYD